MRYDQQAKATAARLLGLAVDGGDGKGAAATLRQFGAPVSNPDTLTVVPGTPSDHPTFFTELGRELANIPGSNVRAGDIRGYLSPLKADGSDLPEPKPDNQLIIGGATYTVVAVGPIQPAQLACAFKVWVRGGA